MADVFDDYDPEDMESRGKVTDYHERMSKRHAHLSKRSEETAKRTGTRSEHDDHNIASLAHAHAKNLHGNDWAGETTDRYDDAMTASEIANRLSGKMNVGDDSERDINPDTGKFPKMPPFKATFPAKEDATIRSHIEKAVHGDDKEAPEETAKKNRLLKLHGANYKE